MLIVSIVAMEITAHVNISHSNIYKKNFLSASKTEEGHSLRYTHAQCVVS